MNFYELLLNRGKSTGEGMTHFERLFAAKFGGSPPPEVREYTGAVPVTITADGTPLLDYLISGNTVQSGTPTPDSPIQPSECGDLEATGEHAGQFKIPISSANTTTPIYLGEVETTRTIKKLVLTGEEPWGKSGDGIYAYFGMRLGDSSTTFTTAVCTHYENVDVTKTSPAIGFMLTASSRNLRIRTNDVENVTLNDFTSYLARQYAAGTPVTVWYVLGTPETGIVNEPIRKIGDYADTLSMEQAGVQIPTNNGSTTVDVETTLKPSEVYIKYMG